MITRKECICAANAAGIIKDAKLLEAKSDLLDRLTRMHKHGMISELQIISL